MRMTERSDKARDKHRGRQIVPKIRPENVVAQVCGVPLDENEGVVKRHLFAAMLCSTAWISEWWRTEACLPAGKL